MCTLLCIRYVTVRTLRTVCTRISKRCTRCTRCTSIWHYYIRLRGNCLLVTGYHMLYMSTSFPSALLTSCTLALRESFFLRFFRQRIQIHLLQNEHTWVTLSLIKPTSSVSSLLGSIGSKRRYFWIKGESCLPEGTIGAGKPSMSPSSIVKPNKQFNPILFYSIQYKWNNDAKELNSEWCRRYPNGPTRTIVRIGAQVHHFLCTKSQSVRMVHGLNPCAMRTVCTSKSVRRQL